MKEYKTLTENEEEWMAEMLKIYNGTNYLIYVLSDEPFWEGFAALHNIFSGEADGAYEGILCKELAAECKILWDKIEAFSSKSYQDFNESEDKQLEEIFRVSEIRIKQLFIENFGEEVTASLYKKAGY
jgi:hypothetical protein